MNAEPQVRHITKLVREGNLAADVEVLVVENEGSVVKAPAYRRRMPKNSTPSAALCAMETSA